MVLNNSTGK